MSDQLIAKNINDEFEAGLISTMKSYKVLITGLNRSLDLASERKGIPYVNGPDFRKTFLRIRRLDNNLPHLSKKFCHELPSTYLDEMESLKSMLEYGNEYSSVEVTEVIELIEARYKAVERALDWYYHQGKKQNRKPSNLKPFPINAEDLENLNIIFFKDEPDIMNLVVGEKTGERTYEEAGFADLRNPKYKVRAWSTLLKAAKNKGKNLKLTKSDVFELNKRLRILLDTRESLIVPSAEGKYESRFKCRISDHYD